MEDKEKILLEIEKDINDFLRSNECIKFRLNLENARGLTKEKAEKFIKYVNEYIKNNISSFIYIGEEDNTWFNFFDDNEYININVKYTLPNGEIEYCVIGMLFACTTKNDINNTRLWSDSTNVYVRLKEQYLYTDIHKLFKKTFKMLRIADIHKIIIKRRKDEIIEEYKNSIKQAENGIKEKIKCKNDIKVKMKEVENWAL